LKYIKIWHPWLASLDSFVETVVQLKQRYHDDKTKTIIKAKQYGMVLLLCRVVKTAVKVIAISTIIDMICECIYFIKD
jgi:hypothetical protein